MIAQSFFFEVAAVITAFAAVVVAVGVIAKSPIGKRARWVLGKLFGEPFKTWFHKNVKEVVQPEIDDLRRENSAQHAQASKQRQETEDRLMARMEEFDTLNKEQHASIRTVLADHLTWADTVIKKVEERFDKIEARVTTQEDK